MRISRHVTDSADAELDAIYLDIRNRLGFDAGETWLSALSRRIDDEIDFVSTPARRALDEDYSRKVKADTYRIILRSRGFWRIRYQLLDADRDGEIDTLSVVAIRSATGGE